MDWRQPWLGPRIYQYASFVAAAVVGALLLSPWCMHSWQAWEEVHDAQAKLRVQQQAMQVLREQTAKWLQMPNQAELSLMDVSALSQLAQQHGLQLSQIRLDKPEQNPTLTGLHLQQLPVHLRAQGSWHAWLEWLAQWPASAPGVTVASLELKANPQGGISAHVLAMAPQLKTHESLFELASLDSELASPADPFSATQWLHMQRVHAMQHASYARLIAPELLRPREPLEMFPYERLRYVGQIASGSEIEALVKVIPPTSTQKDTSMMNVYRLRVGGHLGHSFGQVLAIQSDQLLVRELVLMPTGEWQSRELRMPLNEEAL